jgi:hypothetical protein
MRTEAFCSRCRETKPIDEFYKCRARSTGVTPLCRLCSTIANRAWVRSPSGIQRRKAHNLRRRLRAVGVTVEWYEAQMVKQKGLCAICEQPEKTHKDRLLSVDHCHVTGVVRGLLCSKCNAAIGLLGDNNAVAIRAYRYLTAWLSLRIGGMERTSTIEQVLKLRPPLQPMHRA